MQNIKIGNLIIGEEPLIVVPLTDRWVLSVNSLNGADIIELRIDMFSDLSSSHLKDVFMKTRDKFKTPIIATCRSANEGGAKDISDENRLSIIEAVIDISDAIDVEINSNIVGKVVSSAKGFKKITIASYHNFSETPSIDELTDLYKKGKSLDADIVKIAVMPINKKDMRTITEFTLRHYNNGIVTIAMGDMGRASRIYLPLIGSLFTYASLEKETAPGQLTVEEVRQFF